MDIGPGPDVPLAMLFNFLESAFWLKSGVGDSCFWQFQLLQILIWQKNSNHYKLNQHLIKISSHSNYIHLDFLHFSEILCDISRTCQGWMCVIINYIFFVKLGLLHLKIN